MPKLLLLSLVLGLLAPLGVAADEEAGLEDFVHESRAMVKAFASALKGELQAAIKEGGPIHAISVCSVKAPEIAREVSKHDVWSVGRTSHKIRNPANAPDDLEAKVLVEFRQRAAAGEKLDTMESVALVESNGTQTYRYMKAIPVGEVCLACHGSNLDPELKATIEAVYPEDQATGFTLGELRGAFTVTKTLAN